MPLVGEMTNFVSPLSVTLVLGFSCLLVRNKNYETLAYDHMQMTSVNLKAHNQPIFPEFKATSSSPEGLLISPQREFKQQDRSQRVE